MKSKNTSNKNKSIAEETHSWIIPAVIILFILVSVIAIGGNLYYQSKAEKIKLNETSGETVTINNSKVHVPVILGPNDTLVSFRIDDITFETKQKQVLLNALELARKYNITFDLAVIAKTFDEKADPEVFKIYQDNQDVFELVAHGYTHTDYQNESCHSVSCFINKSCGEFKCASYELQKEKISKMEEIFEKNRITTGTKIFAVPWYAGDEITVEIAKKQGYKLIVQDSTKNKSIREINDGEISVSGSYLAIKMNKTLTNEEIQSYIKNFNQIIQNGRNNLEITTHPINYQYQLDSIKNLIGKIKLEARTEKIKISFISDRPLE